MCLRNLAHRCRSSTISTSGLTDVRIFRRDQKGRIFSARQMASSSSQATFKKRFDRRTFQMTLGRVAGKRHSILSQGSSCTPPQSIHYFAFFFEFLETSKSRPARLLATFRMWATRKRYKHKWCISSSSFQCRWLNLDWTTVAFRGSILIPILDSHVTGVINTRADV